MTPEQEVLEDALDVVRQRIATFADELTMHASFFPLSLDADWDNVPRDLQTNIAAFSKRYEMTADHLVRKLFRSILANSGSVPRTKAIGDVIRGVAALGVINDEVLWDDIVATRNTLAHDYMMKPRTLAPVINKAWQYAPVLIAAADRADTYINDQGLLRPKG